MLNTIVVIPARVSVCCCSCCWRVFPDPIGYVMRDLFVDEYNLMIVSLLVCVLVCLFDIYNNRNKLEERGKRCTTFTSRMNE